MSEVVVLPRLPGGGSSVLRRFGGRVYWVTVGRDARRDVLVGKVNDLVRQISPHTAYPFTDVRQAAEHLAALLAVGPPRLIVLDDVWFDDQLAAFLVAGRCVRLVTTRVPSLVPGSGVTVRVGQMSAAQARAVLTADLPSLPTTIVDAVMAEAGRWPLLLRLINKILVDQSGFRADATAVAEELLQRLRRWGALQVDELTGAAGRLLDVDDPDRRQHVVAATIEASTGLLSVTELDRFAELAIFAEDEPIGIPLVAGLWRATDGLDAPSTRLLCSRLAELSLVTLSATADGGVIRLHDRSS